MENLLGIKLAPEIAKVETALFQEMRERVLDRFETNTRLTAHDICDMHRQWLGPLYSWAGKYRTVNISKGGIGFWCPAGNIAAEMKRFEVDTLAARMPIEQVELDRISESLAIVHEHFLVIHPFREGNGRMARWIADLMILQIGRPPLGWSHVLTDVQAYFEAMRSAHLGDITPLQTIFRSALEVGPSPLS